MQKNGQEACRSACADSPLNVGLDFLGRPGSGQAVEMINDLFQSQEKAARVPGRATPWVLGLHP